MEFSTNKVQKIVPVRIVEEIALETMSLAELLYYALFGDGSMQTEGSRAA